MSEDTHSPIIANNSPTVRIALASLLLSAGALVFFFKQTWAHLFGLWTAGTAGEYAHGLLIVAVSGYLIFTDRSALMRATIKPSFLMLAAVAAVSLLWSISQIVGVLAFETLAVILLPLLICWSILGHQVNRILFFPLAFLIFSVPTWGLLSPILQTITAHVSHAVISILGIPALLEGYYITLPAGQFVVEEGCSGIRYFTVACAIGSLFAYLQYSRWRYRVGFFITVVSVAIAANWLRVIIVLYVGQKTAMESSLIHDHLTLGWIIFAVLILPLFWFSPVESDVPVSASKYSPSAYSNNQYRSSILLALFILPTMLIGPGLMSRQNQTTDGESHFSPHFADTVNGWSIINEGGDSWQPVFINADFNTTLSYRQNDQVVHVYIADYLHQHKDKELINVYNQSYGGEFWRPDTGEQKTVNAAGYDITQTKLVSNSDVERLQWHWYVIADIPTNNNYAAKLLEVWKIVSGKKHSFFMALSTDIEHAPETSEQRLKQFLSDVWPQIEFDLANSAVTVVSR